MVLDISDYQSIEVGTLRLACPPGSPLAAAIVALWQSGRMGKFALALRRQADAGPRTGLGVCHEVVMAFLEACGPLDVRALWARTPTGWHTWVEFGDEAFDVVLAEGEPLVLVQDVTAFRVMRGIAACYTSSRCTPTPFSEVSGGRRFDRKSSLR